MPAAWCPRQESNLHLRLRRSPFYPLNYGGVNHEAPPYGVVHHEAPPYGGVTVDFVMAASAGVSWKRKVQITSSEFSSPLCKRSVKRWAMR